MEAPNDETDEDMAKRLQCEEDGKTAKSLSDVKKPEDDDSSDEARTIIN